MLIILLVFTCVSEFSLSLFFSVFSTVSFSFIVFFSVFCTVSFSFIEFFSVLCTVSFSFIVFFPYFCSISSSITDAMNSKRFNPKGLLENLTLNSGIYLPSATLSNFPMIYVYELLDTINNNNINLNINKKKYHLLMFNISKNNL